MGKAKTAKKYAKFLTTSVMETNANHGQNDIEDSILSDLGSFSENKRYHACNILANLFEGKNVKQSIDRLKQYCTSESLQKISLRFGDVSARVKSAAALALQNISGVGYPWIAETFINTGVFGKCDF